MSELLDIWNQAWSSVAQERGNNLEDTSQWRKSAAKTRSPEDGDWWFTNGYRFLDNWVTWRKNNPQWKIALVNNEPAIEVAANAWVGEVQVKMVIDRVLYNTDTNQYAIVDLKTGKKTPTMSLQLGFYSYGLRKVYNLDIKDGYYWNARMGELSMPFDLAAYSDSKIETMVQMFDTARKSGIYMPNYDHCKMCGYKDSCTWYIEEKE